jgi:hypothetical protein
MRDLHPNWARKQDKCDAKRNKVAVPESQLNVVVLQRLALTVNGHITEEPWLATPVGFYHLVITMYKSVLCTLFVASLGVAKATLLDHKPGLLMASSAPQSELKPFKGEPIESQFDRRDTNPLAGLLARSASACPSGYGECSNNHSKCCPIGGSCCKTKCCKSGYFCYSTGSAFYHTFASLTRN